VAGVQSIFSESKTRNNFKNSENGHLGCIGPQAPTNEKIIEKNPLILSLSIFSP
jgi:hypothetical protein